MEGSTSIPQYTSRATTVASSLPSNPDSIFCDACLKHQRLFVASIAQFEDSEDENAGPGKNYYRYRRNLVDRYPQCCEQCKPKVQQAILKADYKAKTDFTRNMLEKSRDPKNWVTSRRTWRDHVSWVGRMAWNLALVLQLTWHAKVLADVALTDASGMRDPDDASWTTKALEMIGYVLGCLPEDDTLICWSLLSTLGSVWWNPKFVQVLRGFDRHLIGMYQWYGLQFLLCAIRFGLVYLSIGEQPKNAQMAAHIAIILMVSAITYCATKTIRVDNTPLFGDHKGQPQAMPDPINATRQGFSFWREPERNPSMAEALNEALPRPGESATDGIRSVDSTRTNYSYQFTAAPKAAPDVPSEADADMMEWQPTGSTTLPRALRTSATQAGNRPFGQAPVQENNRPFYYRAPEAPTNPAKQARTSSSSPFVWQNHRSKTGFEPEQRSRERLEFQQPKFFAQQPAPDREHDEQLAGLAGSLSFDEPEPKKKGWFGFGKK